MFEVGRYEDLAPRAFGEVDEGAQTSCGDGLTGPDPLPDVRELGFEGQAAGLAAAASEVDRDVLPRLAVPGGAPGLQETGDVVGRACGFDRRQALGDRAEMNLLGVIGLLLDGVEDLLLPGAPALEAPNAAVDDAVAQDGRERLARGQQPALDHLSEDPEDSDAALERVFVGHLSTQDGDVVGGEPFVAGVVDPGQDGLPLLDLGRRDVERLDGGEGFGERGQAGATREDEGLVLRALQDPCPLEPVDGRLDAGFLLLVRRIESAGERLLEQELARGDDAALDVLDARRGQLLDRAPDRPQVVAAQVRHCRHREAGLRVARRPEENGGGGLSVAARASGLLQVGLEAARHVEMDDQPDVVLVDAHAEGVRGCDDPDVAADEVVLALAALVGVEPSVVVLGGKAQGGQLVGDLFRAAPAAAEHDRRAVMEVLLQQIDDRMQTIRRRDLANLIREVDPGGAPVDELDVVAAELLRVLDDLAGRVGLRRRGEQEDGRHRARLGDASDRLEHVRVVGPEVVTPLRQTVGLVEDHRADLATLQESHDSVVSKLLRGQVEEPARARPDLFEHLRPKEARQTTVDCASVGNAVLEGVDLVLHQGLQGRDDDGELSEQPIARLRRHLKAKGLAASRRQDSERRLFAQAAGDEVALEGCAVGERRFLPVDVEPEHLAEPMVRTQIRRAPRAGRVLARSRPQIAGHRPYLGPILAHPSREHRAGLVLHPEPRVEQDVGHVDSSRG